MPHAVAPYVSKLPRQQVKSSDCELIVKIKAEYQNAWEANRWEMYQIMNAWRMYFGAPGEQWDDKTRAYKEENEQRVAQYNMIKQKINTFTGMLIADEYDFAFNPINGIRTTGIEALENAYHSDKEICDFDYQYGLAIEDGVIHVGILEVQVTTEFDPLGNICFRRAVPMRWVIDPYWKTDNDRDCMKAWKQGHMTLQQLKNAFKNLPYSAKLEADKQRENKVGMNYTRPSLAEYNHPFPVFENAYHVIEAHWVEELHKKRIIAKDAYDEWVPFPVTEDNEELEMFARQHGVENFQEGEAKVVPYKDKIHYSATICTELFPYNLLDNGKPEVQIKGLPIIQFTTKRDIAGRNIGKVQELIDPQKDLNYAQSKTWELLANQLGGGLVYSKEAITNESVQEDFEKNHNDPSRVWPIEGNAKDFSTHLREANVNPELARQGANAFDLADRIGGVSAAMSSQTQGAAEPASLYAMKIKVNQVGTLTIAKRVKRFRGRMSNAYYDQSQITYAGTERKFTSKDGKKISILNEDLGGGNTKNKVEDMPRVSISITEAENNLNKQMRDRADLAEILESMPPEYREAIAITYGELFNTTTISEDKKMAINEALMLEQIKARIASIAEITNSEATVKQGQLMTLQIDAQLKKVMGMLGQMQPEAGELEEMVSRGPQGDPEENTTSVNPDIVQQTTQPTEEQFPVNNIQEPL